jgi:hypothetical protein
MAQTMRIASSGPFLVIARLCVAYFVVDYQWQLVFREKNTKEI